MKTNAPRRVVVTGIGAFSPLGNDWPTVEAKLRSKTNAVQRIPAFAEVTGLHCNLGAPAAPFEVDPTKFTRRATRSMGRVALLAAVSADKALAQAGLLGDPRLTQGRVGVSFGSSSGSPSALADFVRMLKDKSTDGITANTYVRMMSHTAAVNLSVHFGLTGRIITTSSACTSGSMGLGCAFEAIRAGHQDAMLAGGSEELDVTQVAVFDTLFATSTLNDTPHATPRPFDAHRDGLVLGEGACTFVLEALDHAQARGATIIAELVGFGTNSDGTHVTNPNSVTMAKAMRLALDCAGLEPHDIGYVNAHGTATKQGDVAESKATSEVFGPTMKISSLKSYMGHTLGACGALEAWMTLEMQRIGWASPNLNLETVDPECGALDYILGDGRSFDAEYVMTNNFAFGGINTSLIFKRFSP